MTKTIELDFKVGKVFRRLQKMVKNKDKKYISFRGGTSSGKTISILQWLLLYGLENPNKTINIVAETMPKARKGVIKDFLSIVLKDFISQCTYNKTEQLFTLPNGSTMTFMSAEDEGKVRGIRADITYFDEINTIKEEVVDQLSIRTRYLVMSSWNPSAIFPWYENNCTKKSFIEDVSTYKDNVVLEQSIIDDLIDRGERSVNFKRCFIDGEWGSAEGLVFEENHDWQLTDQLPDFYDEELFGMDFGFTHPTGIVQCRFVGNDIYVREMTYKSGLVTNELAQEIKDCNPFNITVVADSEDARGIAELKKVYGLNMKAIKKESRLDSIDNLKMRNIFVTKDSLNLIKELRNYSYSKTKTDKKNRPLPEKVFDDLIDPLRYTNDHRNKPKTVTTTNRKRTGRI